MTLGNSLSTPPSCLSPCVPLTDSQEKQDAVEQSPIKMGLTYCTIQSFSLPPFRFHLSQQDQG